MRATTDQMALTEKLLHDIDRPKSEVVIDVIVMQVNSQYSRSLAATLSSAGTTGVQQSIGFLPSTGSDGNTSNGTIPLSQIRHLSINDFSTSLPGAIVNAVMSDARTKTMNKPQSARLRRHEGRPHYRRKNPFRDRQLFVRRVRESQQ